MRHEIVQPLEVLLTFRLEIYALVCGSALRVVAGQAVHQLAGCTAAPPPIRKSTAIRTARPLVTCSRITERTLSAMSLLISTPRLIGPGCMIRASGLVRAN